MDIKNKNGIGLTDAIIAVVILMIFASVIVSISYNIYLNSSFVKRNEKATSYATDVLEYAKQLIIDEEVVEETEGYLSATNLLKHVNDRDDKYAKAVNDNYTDSSESIAPYSIYITIENIYEGYVKKVNVTVMYMLGNKRKTVEISTLISK